MKEEIRRQPIAKQLKAETITVSWNWRSGYQVDRACYNGGRVVPLSVVEEIVEDLQSQIDRLTRLNESPIQDS